MRSEKQGIGDLVEVLARQGLRHVIISPGSRNAPLTISFAQHPDLECLSIADERSAAFFAMGIAQQTRQPVVISCTSGSAALNYAPAIVEAYYQKIPLIVITADRPVEWTDQGDGQTIRQTNIFANYIKGSYELPQDPSDADALWFSNRLVSEAWNTAMHPDQGPVHLNIPFREPLYGQTDQTSNPKVIQTRREERRLNELDVRELASLWNASSRKLILTGMMTPNAVLNERLHQLADDPSVAVLTETTSNLHSPLFNPCIDSVVNTFEGDDETHFAPDLLVTMGGPVISKMVKAFLRKANPKNHWHVDVTDHHLDTYQSLTDNLPILPETFCEQLLQYTMPVESGFAATWKQRDERSAERGETYLNTIPWSDFKAFEVLLSHLPAEGQLQLANSTAVRYAQLFKALNPIPHYANRGTSGIDGSTSTAAGAAFATGQMTTLITGDMAFFYDSNAFWNQHLTGNLRVILINNGGGGIFRVIKGPSSTNQLEQFFETAHDYDAEHLAKAYKVGYYSCENEEELRQALKGFYQPHNNRPVILEVKTPRLLNDQLLKDYFVHLRKD